MLHNTVGNKRHRLKILRVNRPLEMIDMPFQMVEQSNEIIEKSCAKWRGFLGWTYLKSPDKKRLQGSVYCGCYDPYSEATTIKFSMDLCIKI